LVSASTFREPNIGRRSGAGASVARALLRIAEVPYTAAVGWRNRRYDRGTSTIHRARVPVVSVGNLTLGGTGKTPMVEWLARWFGERGVRVALVSRGYGASSGKPNDEALELAQKLPGVLHLQNPDRASAAEQAVQQGAQLVLLDDGFQHRRLHRDLDIVLIDALEPKGFGHVFPRGTLREPLASLGRAQAVVLSRADLLESDARTQVRSELSPLAPSAAWIEAAHAPRLLVSADGQTQALDSLAGQSIAAFCGIGNPAAFRATLEKCGYRVASFREFPDHHPYGSEELDVLSVWADNLDVSAVVCTQKDLVKLTTTRLAEKPLWALSIGLKLESGQQQLENLLTLLVEQARKSAS